MNCLRHDCRMLHSGDGMLGCWVVLGWVGWSGACLSSVSPPSNVRDAYVGGGGEDARVGLTRLGVAWCLGVSFPECIVVYIVVYSSL